MLAGPVAAAPTPPIAGHWPRRRSTTCGLALRGQREPGRLTKEHPTSRGGSHVGLNGTVAAPGSNSARPVHQGPAQRLSLRQGLRILLNGASGIHVPAQHLAQVGGVQRLQPGLDRGHSPREGGL